MNISHNWLQTYFDKKIPDAQKMASLFPLNSFEIEGLEDFKDEKGKIIDTVIDAKILPDRAHYALSHRGIAEEVSFMTGLSIKKKLAGELPVSLESKPIIKIENPEFCRRYIGRYVELNKDRLNIPSWLKEHLNAIGQRSINPIVDLTNYVMYDIGQPLHAFDADKIRGRIIIRAAKEGEKIVLLDGREITLTPADNVIADDEGPLVVAGAKGGKRAEISETTKRIMIESANFDPTAVRRTSTKYDIRSDSSKRFENEITQELAILGMNEICALLNEMMPGSKFGQIADEYPIKAEQTIIKFNPEYLEERLSIKIPFERAKEILESMGIKVSVYLSSGQSSIWSLTIPFERLDLKIPEDIVEEIGRIYGYDKITGILPPKVKEAVKVLPIYFLSEKIKDILVNNGFSEVSLYTLVEKGDIETAKPLAKDKAFLRKNLTDGMIACVERNSLNADLLGLQAIKIFEIGHIFSEKDGEQVHLSLGVSQIKKIKGFKSENIIDEAIKLLSIELGLVIDSKIKLLQKGNCAVWEINLGDLLKDLKVPVSYKEIAQGNNSSNRYKKFSLYPFIVRDIAIFVPESVKNEDVWQKIEQGITEAKSLDLLVRHSLFDTFKKDEKVSYAFRMIFQSMEKTLTDDEANKIMEAIYSLIKKEGWEVR